LTQGVNYFYSINSENLMQFNFVLVEFNYSQTTIVSNNSNLLISFNIPDICSNDNYTLQD